MDVRRGDGKIHRYSYNGKNWQHPDGSRIKNKLSDEELKSGQVYRQKPKTSGTTLPTIGPWIAIAAGLAIAGASIYAASEYLNRDAKEAQKAAEIAQAASENYAKQQESYNTFKSQADDYREAIEGLEKLTKGTQEYEEAVMEANSKALELIKLHKELEYEYNSNTGLIEINLESLAKAQRDELKAIKAAQDASMMAEADANQAKFKS
jgi:hypothetical protein